jgi:hypothetical protein
LGKATHQAVVDLFAIASQLCVHRLLYMISRIRSRMEESTMAQKTIVVRTDDFDGKELTQGEGQTINISLDGADYEIDLSAKNAQRLRDDFGKWLDKARKVSSGRGRRRASSNSSARDFDPKAVRRWAQSNGMEVPTRGRIPASLIEQFKAAGN